MKLLLDTNVILDGYLPRLPFANLALEVMMLNENGKIKASISASSVTDIYYFLQKRLKRKEAILIIEKILNEFEILPVGKGLLTVATQLPGDDFEDNLQIACAISYKLDGIVTRDQSGFSHSSIPVFTPAQLIAKLAIQ